MSNEKNLATVPQDVWVGRSIGMGDKHALAALRLRFWRFLTLTLLAYGLALLSFVGMTIIAMGWNDDAWAHGLFWMGAVADRDDVVWDTDVLLNGRHV